MLQDKVCRTETHLFYRRLGQWWTTDINENNWSFLEDRSQVVNAVELDEEYVDYAMELFNKCTSPNVKAYLEEGVFYSTEVIIEGELFKVVFEQVTEPPIEIGHLVPGLPLGQIIGTLIGHDVESGVAVLEHDEDVALFIQSEQFRHDAREAIWDARYDR